MLRRNLLEETCSKIIQFCNKHYLKDGICIHSPIFKLGVQDNLLLSNNLLSLYAKCCGIEHARHLFDEMPYRDVVSWTGVLSAYVKDGNHEEALRFFHLMKVSGEKPNEVTFSNVLRSCSVLGNLVYGTRVQACVIKHGFESNPILCSSLIELYSKWDFFEEAVGVFNAMENGDTVSWTAIISSLMQAGKRVRALRFFMRMIEGGVSPNEYTFVKLLGACSSLGINYGKLVHAQLKVWGVRLNLILSTALVDMYAKCQKMEDAVKVLKQTSGQDVQLWTTVITSFTQNMNFQEAISAFRQMVGNNIVPNNYTYAGILNACSSMQALQLGKQIHTQLIMAGLENDISVGNALIDFYSKCSNAIEDVVRVFKGIPIPNVISWTALIAGFAAHGLRDECFLAFLEMQFSGQQPNSVTLLYILQACGTTQSPWETRKIHGFVIKTNADNDVVVGNALVEAYAGSHMVGCALSLAKGMSNRTVITYTMLALRLNQIGHHKTTLEIINHMRDDELPIDGFTISSFLSASANLGATETGKQLHCYSIVSGFQRWTSVLNGLIDFYGKCLCIVDAQKAFHEIFEPDIVSWNCLMHGFAVNGHTTAALSTLEDMRLAGFRPDSITLLTVLFACNQGGLVDMGVEYFHSLRERYDIEPQLNHYNLLVDLLGRAGRLEEAVSVLKSTPFRPNASIYKRLLHACKLHGNVLLGEEMARKGLELDPSDLEFYVLLAGLYYEAGRYDLGDNIRSQSHERERFKEDSCL
ncbi:Pentatricopeptide repeat-containing protein, chloroplastic [Sesamum alatum]|uniref:Pentatricopeptide repeat-containing protein, chloroplastic n=1 Tax=Sesamum alatum TaxID=300844 RepID=A0AAE2CVL1_9LAMI|nr:Pentatricopeptide repeat-containing protein, chloroplastic [Sesamum alatum]